MKTFTFNDWFPVCQTIETDPDDKDDTTSEEETFISTTHY